MNATCQTCGGTGMAIANDEAMDPFTDCPDCGCKCHDDGEVLDQRDCPIHGGCATCGGVGWIVEGQTIGWSYGEQVQCPDCRQ